MRRTTIGVIGNATPRQGSLPPERLAVAREVGRAVAEANAVLLSGGTNGVMEAASQGAHEAGGFTVGFLPQGDHEGANRYLDLALPTGMGTIRNVLTSRCSDAVIVIGGGVGTLNEMTLAYDVGTPIVAMAGSGGWADRIREVLIEDTWLDDRRVVAIDFIADPAEAVARAIARGRIRTYNVSLPSITGAAAQ